MNNADYVKVKDAAEKWGISERRVRILCKEGRISGTFFDGKSYRIPENAKKPSDARCAGQSKQNYLKWKDDVIGIIDPDCNVRFTQPLYNDTVRLYTRGLDFWSRQDFESFLSDRLVSKDRRDIEHILFKLGFSHYRILDLAFATRAINSADLLWIAFDEAEKLSDVLSDVFKAVFGRKEDLEGESVDSPEGYNIKRYGVYNGAYGIYKNRIHPLSTDVEAEVAVYKLACKLGVPCCPAYKVSDECVFSEFMYKIPDEYIVHFRRFFDYSRGSNEYYNLLSVRPQYQADFAKMIALDFITRQDDRHLSNIAVKINSAGESFYPLYDNGRSLFYEDAEETLARAVKDIPSYSTVFGPEGSYYDFVMDLKSSGTDFGRLLNLDITKKEIEKILKESGFKSYRLDGNVEWIWNALEIIRKA